MDSTTKKLLPEKIEWLKFSKIDWTIDGKGFFYNSFDKPKSSKDSKMNDKAGTEKDSLSFNKVYYHRVGTQ